MLSSGSTQAERPRMNPIVRRTALLATAALIMGAAAARAGTTVDLAGENAPSIRGTSAEEQFGYCAAIGDLDGDGGAELVVGAPGLADSALGEHTGGVLVFRASVVDALTEDADAAHLAEWVLAGARPYGRYGTTVAVADLDGDGCDDLVVGAPAAGDGDRIASGEVSLYFGGRDGSWSLGENTVPDLLLAGTSAGGRLGTALLANDLDGDGAAELLVSEPGGGTTRAGVVYVLEGQKLRSVRGSADVSDLARASVSGESREDALMLLAVADANGDGEKELVLAAAQADGRGTDLPDAGRVYLVPARGMLNGRRASLPGDAVSVMTGVTGWGFLGGAVSAGDMDYDGTDDLLIAAYGSRADGPKLEATGEIFVIFGRESAWEDSGPAEVPLDAPSVPRYRGGSRSDLLGLPVIMVDLNGDGPVDLVAAAQYADGPDDGREACGEVYIYWGSLRSVMLAKAGTTDLADVTIIGASPDDAIGGTLMVMREGNSRPRSLLIGAPNASTESEDGATMPRSGRLILLPTRLLVK
jgi:hypothetical protein